MNALPEKQKEVMLTLLSLVEPPGKDKGCLNYGIFSDIRDNNVFNVISEWQTRQCLELHLQSDRIGIMLGTKSLMSEALKIQIVPASDREGMEAVNVARKKGKVLIL